MGEDEPTLEEAETIKKENKEIEKPTAKPAEEPAAPTEQVSMIDKANEAAARLERANIEHAKIVARQEALAVEKTLGGKAEAGKPGKEESPEEYSKRIMAGDDDGKK